MENLKEYTIVVAENKKQKALNFVDQDSERELNNLVWLDKRSILEQKKMSYFSKNFSKENLIQRMKYLSTDNYHAIEILIDQLQQQKINYFIEKGVSKDEAFCFALSLNFYTYYYGDGREHLEKRPGKFLNFGENLTKEEEKNFPICNYTVRALNYLPEYWGFCMRAVELSKYEQNKYKIGSLIKWIQISSCTKNKTFPEYLEGRNTHFYIYSLKGRYVKKFSTWPEEEEIMFLPNSFFLVCNIKTIENKNMIYLREITFDVEPKTLLWMDENIFKITWENNDLIQKITGLGNNSWNAIPNKNFNNLLNFINLELEEINSIKNYTFFEKLTIFWDLEGYFIDEKDYQFEKDWISLTEALIKKNRPLKIQNNIFLLCFNTKKVFDKIKDFLNENLLKIKEFQNEDYNFWLIDYEKIEPNSKIPKKINENIFKDIVNINEESLQNFGINLNPNSIEILTKDFKKVLEIEINEDIIKNKKISTISKIISKKSQTPIIVQKESPQLLKYENASTLPLTFVLDTDFKTFNEKDFLNNFASKMQIPLNSIKIISCSSGSTVVQVEILAFEKDGTKMTVGAIAEQISEPEACKKLFEFAIFLIEFGNPKDEFQPLQQKIMMNPKFNRKYGQKYIIWNGTLNNDKCEPYFCPQDWEKYAIMVDNSGSAKEFDNKYARWPVAYHGTGFSSSMMISYSKLKAGVKATNKGNMCFGSGVYFTPSIIYASHPRYANPMKMSESAEYFPGKWVQVVMNFRLRPGSYSKYPETLGVGNTMVIDTNYNNNEIEWFLHVNSGEYVNENDAIFCGYMIRVTDEDPLNLPSSQWWMQIGSPEYIRVKWYEESERNNKPIVYFDNKGKMQTIKN